MSGSDFTRDSNGSNAALPSRGETTTSTLQSRATRNRISRPYPGGEPAVSAEHRDTKANRTTLYD